MLFTFGGGAGNPKVEQHLDAVGRAFALTSYFETRERESRGMERIKPGKEVPIKLMLDSGAFSAWKRGVEIDIDEYCEYIKKHEHLLYSYVTLDTIPGKPNVRKTQAEINSSAELSYKNQQYMKKKGLAPIPVFHMGEDFRWLRRYMDDGEPYIGISPAADLPQGQIREWLDRAFTAVCDKDGWPTVKTHGFGVASFALLKRYPWFTADATSWALTAAYGSVYIPVYKGKVPDYTQPPVKLTVSEVDRKAGELPSDHYLRYGPIMKERVVHFLTHEVGVKVEDAAVDYEVRARAIVYFMLKFQDAIGEQPFRHFVQEF